MGELPHQARLADTGLADQGHDLPVRRAGPVQGLSQLIQLGLATDEPGEPAGGTRLQP
jgi:hypothetical protein